jgi:hypothetical protein
MAKEIALREKPIQNAILKEFGSNPALRLWRQNTGVGFYLDPRRGTRRAVRFGVKGAADLTGLVVGTGQRLEIEVKAEGEGQSPEQAIYGQMIRRCGGLYIVARNVEDVYRALSACGICLRPGDEVHSAGGEEAGRCELDADQLALPGCDC